MSKSQVNEQKTSSNSSISSSSQFASLRTRMMSSELMSSRSRLITVALVFFGFGAIFSAQLLPTDCPLTETSIRPLVERSNVSTTTHPEWCPNAQCHNTALCSPCQRSFLIVITSPRSASTTLTWMLDSLPGITMGGENNDALKSIKSMQDRILQDPNMQMANQEDLQGKMSAWSHHPFVHQSFACVSQQMIRDINPPLLNPQDPTQFADAQQEAHEIVGFKTIRFFNGITTQEKEQELASWLNTNFPCARIVININSNVQSEAESLHELFYDKDESRDTIIARIQRKIDQSKRLANLLGPDKAYLLDKVEWTSGNMTYLNDAIQWLGFHESCRFEQLLDLNKRTKGIFGQTYTNNGKTKLKPFPATCKPL